MSADSFRNYSSPAKRDMAIKLSSSDDGERQRAEEERAARLLRTRADIDHGRVVPVPKRDTSQDYSDAAVKLGITKPPAQAERVYVVLIDNSGSNAKIAAKLRETSNYLLANLAILDGGGAIAFIYFSDHCDGPRLMQEADFVLPDDAGVKVMYSSLRHVEPAGGGDFPEAIECALWRACEIDFGHVPKDQRFLCMVTDSFAHGMSDGKYEDHGCREQRDWRASVRRVAETYAGFTVVGCGDDSNAAKIQTKFLAPERVGLDFIDLSAIQELSHRLGITGNALLFLIARQRGPQIVQTFLMLLYEKWLKEPIFGRDSDLKARDAVRRFLKYLELDAAESTELERRIFAA